VRDLDLTLRLHAAGAIIREAGRLALDHFRQRGQLEIELKGRQDLVSSADREVEALIRAQLAAAFPADAIIGEEGGVEAAGSGGPLWVIDPIDGTANFLRGLPYWSVTLALVQDRRLELGVTYDPVHDELFTARRGHGARRDGRPIRVSAARDPGQAVIGSTFTFKMAIAAYVGLVDGILRAGADHRRLGSTALMMAHVADGRLDACATLYCNSWDVLGGLLLVEEAGGVASDFLDGAELDEPNLAFGAAPGLAAAVRALPGMAAGRAAAAPPIAGSG
jgi:myo-inositol-1(or 4)-monophosphatase